MLRPGHAHQIGGPNNFKCATCHDVHGNVSKEMRTEQCMQCHKGHPEWQGSKHAQNGVACADCHNPHSSKPALGASEPQTCYRCHQQFSDLSRVAHPHQVCGAAGMNCATCHNPHGNIKPETRTDLCLQCHKGHPTMAFQSSAHARFGVACTDCHNPHPISRVSPFVDIQHTTIKRPTRLPMQVDQPAACYKCHPKTAAQFALPSHHPLREGKINCSDCHDSHGSATNNLKEPTVNLVCYRCHADKQGPFVWQHPPVEENCGICHNPHGAVANNLLHQPPTFLCLRCHSGHREFRRNPDRNVFMRQPFYTDCSICHAQVHGSDRPAATLTPRLTR
jgi:DmsE family decaheme c-type cytochrome